MKSLPRVRSSPVALSLLTALLVASGAAEPQATLLATTDAPVVVRSVRILPGPAVEILSSRPLVPVISNLDNPPRLVIDLPNADLPSAGLPTVGLPNTGYTNAAVSGNSNGINSPAQEIRRVRVNQYQKAPPVARVVIDLVEPVGHTWDAAGNRLMVRLRSVEQVTAKPLSVPAFTEGIQPAAVPLGPGSSGTLIFAGRHAAAGSSVTAGSETSVLRLERGGEVLVCPGTRVSVTSSQNGRALMLGMNTGALEAHYNLDTSADSILTPDFRILMAGPGEFHYAVSADSRGNTCVRALPGNTASVIVSELLGGGNYQVKPSEQIVFHSGRLSLVDTDVPGSCGCPRPQIPVMRAASPSARVSEASLISPMPLAQPGEESKAVTPGSLPPETAALPASKPNDVHVQVDAPFVFRAEDLPANKPPAPKAAAIPQVELVATTAVPRPATFSTEVLPPPQNRSKPARHGVFAKIKGFFAGIFS
jgi:hypothetical protein